MGHWVGIRDGSEREIGMDVVRLMESERHGEGGISYWLGV